MEAVDPTLAAFHYTMAPRPSCTPLVAKMSYNTPGHLNRRVKYPISMHLRIYYFAKRFGVQHQPRRQVDTLPTFVSLRMIVTTKGVGLKPVCFKYIVAPVYCVGHL